eukprot:SAG31_NODE_10_length_40133_cov_27.863041_20_plen_158_part_00
MINHDTCRGSAAPIRRSAPAAAAARAAAALRMGYGAPYAARRRMVRPYTPEGPNLAATILQREPQREPQVPRSRPRPRPRPMSKIAQLRPLLNRVLVARTAAAAETKGGIIIPEQVRAAPHAAVVHVRINIFLRISQNISMSRQLRQLTSCALLPYV